MDIVNEIIVTFLNIHVLKLYKNSTIKIYTYMFHMK